MSSTSLVTIDLASLPGSVRYLCCISEIRIPMGNSITHHVGNGQVNEERTVLFVALLVHEGGRRKSESTTGHFVEFLEQISGNDQTGGNDREHVRGQNLGTSEDMVWECPRKCIDMSEDIIWECPRTSSGNEHCFAYRSWHDAVGSTAHCFAYRSWHDAVGSTAYCAAYE